jgi:uncharacterized YigZ family protein
MSYLIPAQAVRTEIAVQKSRFIAHAAFADSTKSAKAFLAEIRRQMPDASHHVYAFRVGHGNSVTEGVSDDGEPSGTSGPPILSILRGTDIGDIIIVVTRYFGGIKLGTGGLVRAYSEAARTALNLLPTEIKVIKVRWLIELPYNQYELAKRHIAVSEGKIHTEEFTSNVLIDCSLPKSNTTQLEQQLQELTAGQAVILKT